MHNLEFIIPENKKLTFKAKNVYCIGNSGRNEEMINKHIKELMNEGIPAPENVAPCFTKVSNYLLSQEDCIQVVGNVTTGEVEFVLLFQDEKVYVTVGSDHADRQLEAAGSPHAKQVSAKPLAKIAWPLEEIIKHWDELRLSCYVFHNGNWELYQVGTVGNLLDISEILEIVKNNEIDISTGLVLFCGTLLLNKGKFVYGDKYKIALEDRVLDRVIEHSYDVQII